MRNVVFFLALLVAADAGGSRVPLQAQSTADSVSVMAALGGSLRDDAITVVANRFGCYHARECAPEELASPSATRLLEVLAASVGARMSAAAQLAPPPPCPAFEGMAPKGGAYRLNVGVPRLHRDSASITVTRVCTWAARARDPILMTAEEFVFKRRGGAWQVVQRELRWRS